MVGRGRRKPLGGHGTGVAALPSRCISAPSVVCPCAPVTGRAARCRAVWHCIGSSQQFDECACACECARAHSFACNMQPTAGTNRHAAAHRSEDCARCGGNQRSAVIRAHRAGELPARRMLAERLHPPVRLPMQSCCGCDGPRGSFPPSIPRTRACACGASVCLFVFCFAAPAGALQLRAHQCPLRSRQAGDGLVPRARMRTLATVTARNSSARACVRACVRACMLVSIDRETAV